MDKYFYKTNGKPLKFKYYYKGKLRIESTKSDQHGIYTRITKMSDKAFVDEFIGRMGVYIKTYFKKTKSGGTEVAKYSTRMDPVTYKTINEYYVNGKRTTKKAYQKKVKVAPGSDAGAYMVPHGKGILQEWEAFRQILGDSGEVKEWLKTGEKEIRDRFKRK